MIDIRPGIQRALDEGTGIVGLESVVFCHGLPSPHGVTAALESERAVLREGAVPASCAVLRGRPVVGLRPEEIESLAADPPPKAGPADLAPLLASRMSGATTAGSTIRICDMAGIKVVATGGIGGVHSGTDLDISADLHILSTCSSLVVCSGPKSILDLQKTYALLETTGVTVVGYRTEIAPGFYTSETDIALRHTAESPEELAEIFGKALLLESSAVLVLNRPPTDLAFASSEIEQCVEASAREIREKKISGSDVTPAQLSLIQQRLGKRAIDLNQALLISNARLAAAISIRIANMGRQAASG